MVALTAAQRQKKYRDNRKNKGLCEIRYFVGESVFNKLQAALNSGRSFESILLSGVSSTLNQSATRDEIVTIKDSHVKKTGIPSNVTPDIGSEIEELNSQGMASRNIGEKVGVSKSTVQRYLKAIKTR